MIDTGTVTVSLLDIFRDSTGQLIGDGIKPETSGWLNQDPNSGVFAPYGVLAFSSGQPRDQTMTYAEQVRSWQTTWRLTYFGASRSQGDLVAGKIRAAVSDILGTISGGYKFTGARWGSLGAMIRDDSTNPSLWSASDTLILMLDA